MALTLTKATKYIKPLKIFCYGPTFSGKTLSSLLIANGIVQAQRKCTEKEAWDHIVIIDTEYKRGALYSNLGGYNYVSIEAPYATEKLDSVLNDLNLMDNIDVVIIDSMTHFWVKEGGLLDQKSIIDKQGGNSYTNWLNVGTKLNNSISLILSSPKHIIITARAKSDTALVPDANNKMVPKTYGLKPELRDGFEYECDITFNIDKEDHSLLVEKGLPGMETTYSMATPELGKTLYELSISNAVPVMRTKEDIIKSIRELSKRNQEVIKFVQLKLSGKKLEQFENIGELESLEKDVISFIRKQQSK